MHVFGCLSAGRLGGRVAFILPGNILPAPLVIFATFVGFQGGLNDGIGTAFAGAIVITIGMFSPCFLFTIASYDLFERLVRNEVGIPLGSAMGYTH